MSDCKLNEEHRECSEEFECKGGSTGDFNSKRETASASSSLPHRGNDRTKGNWGRIAQHESDTNETKSDDSFGLKATVALKGTTFKIVFCSLSFSVQVHGLVDLVHTLSPPVLPFSLPFPQTNASDQDQSTTFEQFGAWFQSTGLELKRPLALRCSLWWCHT